MLKVKFKYKAGDKVLLKKKNLKIDEVSGKTWHFYHSQYWYCKTRDIAAPDEKEYEIKRCCWYMENDGVVHVCYWLDAYCDELIDYHNMIPEEWLEGDINEHEEEYDLTDACGKELKIGDKVYEYVVDGQNLFGKNELEARIHASSWRELEICGFRLHEDIKVKAAAIFLGPDEYPSGKRINSNVHSGHRFTSEHLKCLCKELPDNLTELLVAKFKEYKRKPFKFMNDEYGEDVWLDWWLKKFGLLDEFNKAYKNWGKAKKSNVKKEKVKKDKKVEDLAKNQALETFNNMTDEQRNEMLKMLEIWNEKK